MAVTLRVPAPCDLNLAATGAPLKNALPGRVIRAEADLQGTKHFPASAEVMLLPCVCCASRLAATGAVIFARV